MAYASSNVMTPTTQQRLRALGAVQAGNAPSIQSYVQQNPITTMPSYKAPTTTPTTSTGLVSPKTVVPTTTNAAYDPSQYRAALGNPTTGAGSLDPTVYNPDGTLKNATSQTSNQSTITPGTLGTGSAAVQAANATFPGLVQNLIGNTVGQYQQQAGMINPFIQQNLDTIKQINQQEAALTGGSYSGTAADYSGRLAQLENLKQAAQGNLATEQGALAGFMTPVTSAYGTAIGATQPRLGSIGQVPYNPLDLSQGAILGTTQSGGVQAAGNLLGQLQGAQAAGAAPGQATASNINTQQTAQINALAQTYGQNAPAAFALNQSINNVESLGALTLQTAQGGNINPLTIQAGNQTIADFRRQLGSPSQAAFDSNMANFQSALTAIYADQSGAIPTQVTQWGQQIANGSMPLAQLQAIYQQAIQEGNIRLNNLKATVGSAYSGLQGSNVGGSGASGSTSGFGWNG